MYHGFLEGLIKWLNDIVREVGEKAIYPRAYQDPITANILSQEAAQTSKMIKT
jgi:hypothetical protein